MALGTAKTKKAASRALAELTGAGIYPPDWVTEIGKPVPGQAWRRYDVFGDDEAVLVTFSYGEVEHAVVVQVDLTGIPVATAAGVAPDPASLIEAINRNSDGVRASGADQPDRGAPPDGRPGGPVRGGSGASHRYRHPPAPRPDPDPPPARRGVRPRPPSSRAADRAAAVDDFMKSPLAADAVAADEESTRFWAQVLTGYSSRIDGEAPAQVGPRKLAHLLLGHVATTFDLSPAQRQHLEPAVTAWVRWSAAYRDLSEAATAHLLERCPRRSAGSIMPTPTRTAR